MLFARTAGVLALAPFAQSLCAADGFPAKSIRIINGSVPGTLVDQAARLYGERMSAPDSVEVKRIARMFRDNRSCTAWNITYHDALLCGGRQMDGVIADSTDGQHFQTWQSLQNGLWKAETAARIQHDISLCNPLNLCRCRLWAIEIQANVSQSIQLGQQW